ncbi:hypothetical protein ACFWUU_05455 [Kribbella sp. NPDC058693]|uniref:hypothetical protein n=1 Tax=Kribbella sp. NPDC058693 TaxID=3346602 RepID=UPI00364AF002
MNRPGHAVASSMTTVADAARLIAYSFRPKVLPARDDTYRVLVRRFQDDDTFAETVRAVAVGLDLVILDADIRHGLVVASTEESVFAIKMTDYAKRTGGEGKAAERVIHALAQLGAAALAYPRPADLSNAAYVGRITVHGVDAFVREAARRLAESAARERELQDPDPGAPDLEAAWRVYSRRAATPGSGDGRRVASSTVGIVGKALTFLADQGLLTRRSGDDGGTYVTTSRYRVQVREAGQRMFSELLALGITSVTDGTGTLTRIEWSTEDLDLR